MKKWIQKDSFFFVLLVIFIFSYVLFLTDFGQYLYGSVVDWDCQHWAIPDYFRTLFYETGDLFPNFAFHLGSGQNIFYLSYYGLFSPIVLISYFLPFVKMVDYIQIISILGILISGILFYRWILSHTERKTAFLTTILFVTTVPILFHSHRHIMFTNYMPFLVLAFMGVDRYFEEKKKSLLIFSIFFMILCSYFFSVSALFAIVIYAIYCFFQHHSNVTFSSFCKEGLAFCIPIFIGIMMAAFLLLPTVFVILSGRSTSNVSVDLLSLLKPIFPIDRLFYQAYSPGLSAFSFIALLFAIFLGKKEEKIFAILLGMVLVFPIFTYILNGTMYVDYKVLIPFVPLFLFLVGNFIQRSKKVEHKKLFLGFTLVLGLFLFLVSKKNQVECLFFVELLSVLFLFYFENKKRDKWGECSFSLAVLVTAIFSIVATSSDHLYARSQLEKLENSYDVDSISEILKKDSNIYRITNQKYLLQNINRVPNTNFYLGNIYSSTSNKNYKDFYYQDSFNEITQRSYGKITSSMNIFYDLYRGNKYFVKDEFLPIGYRAITDELFINEDALPMIYASSHLMNQKFYEKLSFPDKMEALLKYIIVEEGGSSEFESSILPFAGSFSISSQDPSLHLEKKENGYYILSEKESQMNLALSGLEEGDIFILKFSLANNQSCSKGDLAITINGIENVLTCKSWKYHNQNFDFHYVISSSDVLKELAITFSKGNFEISDLEMYQVSYEDIRHVKESVDEFAFDKDKTKGDFLAGKIDVTNDGYLYLSFPYDKGFSIFLNGEKVEYERVDQNFIGVKVSKGTYDVEIEYHAPYFKEGVILSIFGFAMGTFIVIKERKSKKGIAKK